MQAQKPKLGDQLLFRPKDSSAPEDARNVATIAKVNLDGTVNIGTLSDHGVSENEQNVVIVDGDPGRGEAEWPEAGGLLGAARRFHGDVQLNSEEERIVEMIVEAAKMPPLSNERVGEIMKELRAKQSEHVLPEEDIDDEVVTDDDLINHPDGTDEATDDLSEEIEYSDEGERGEETLEEVELSVIDDQVIFIAETCHEANRSYCESIGDDSQLPWEDAPDWQKDSAMNGVRDVINNPKITPRDTHERWLAKKQVDGWIYGEEKDAEFKTHPCILPYEELPEEQRKKDELFIATVRGCLDSEAA